MWFFDAVLEEKPATNSVSTTVATTTPASDVDDGSFLILTDTAPATSAPVSMDDSSVFVAPQSEATDSIVLSDDSTASSEAIVFFDSEESQIKDSGSDEIAFAEEAPIIEPVSANIMDAVFAAPIEAAPVLVSTPKDETPVSPAADIFSSGGSGSAPTDDKQDPNAILVKAIAELEALLANHARLAADQDREIEMQNARIAEAKAAAKRALEARKKIESEMERVNKMKELFSSQLSK